MTPATPDKQTSLIHTADGQPRISARDLATRLGYSSWQYFEPVVRKAIAFLTEIHGEDRVNDWVMETHKPIVSGKGRVQQLKDWSLTLEAALAVAADADSSKPAVAAVKAELVAARIAIEAIRTNTVASPELLASVQRERELLVQLTESLTTQRDLALELADTRLRTYNEHRDLTRQLVASMRETIAAHQAHLATEHRVGETIERLVPKNRRRPPQSLFVQQSFFDDGRTEPEIIHTEIDTARGLIAEAKRKAGDNE